ncbi:MAG: hypothetical protein GEV03_15185 [Streptosporangiales bacterium]|nr:hypothetical protein [Streptosporangiales bacterium]
MGVGVAVGDGVGVGVGVGLGVRGRDGLGEGLGPAPAEPSSRVANPYPPAVSAADPASTRNPRLLRRPM